MKVNEYGLYNAINIILNAKQYLSSNIEMLLSEQSIEIKEDRGYSLSIFTVSYIHPFGSKVLFKLTKEEMDTPTIKFVNDIETTEQEDHVKDIIMLLSVNSKILHDEFLIHENVKQNELDKDFKAFLKK